MMKKIVNEKKNKWKIVLVKTIDNTEPVYYRLANLATYEIIEIPAYRIFDEVFNKGLDIVNLKCENNKPVLIDSDGYASTAGVIVIDEFDREVSNIWDWCLENDIGNYILGRYDSDKNAFSPENFRVDSDKKLAWTCENKHTIHCGFPTYFSTDGKCPICEIEKSGEIPSLDYWARITNNKDILNMYETASDNQDAANKISYKTNKKVWFRDMDTGEEVMEALNEITVNGKKPPFKNKVKVNLKH